MMQPELPPSQDVSLCIWKQIRELGPHLFDLLFGYDYFIAHRSRDGRSYAAALHGELLSGDKSLDCFLDLKHYRAGGLLKAMQSRALSSTSRLVVIVTEGAHDPDTYLLKEVDEFRLRHPDGVIVPIAEKKYCAETWKGPVSPLMEKLPPYPETIWIVEEDGALVGGVPSRDTIIKLRIDFTETRRATLRQRWLLGTALLLALLTLAAILFAIEAQRALDSMETVTVNTTLREVTEYLENDRPQDALAQLAATCRRFPDNSVIATRLSNLLSTRDWAMPLSPQLRPPSRSAHGDLPILCLRLSPDENFLVVVRRDESGDLNWAEVWDTGKRELLVDGMECSEECANQVKSEPAALFSADSSYFACYGNHVRKTHEDGWIRDRDRKGSILSLCTLQQAEKATYSLADPWPITALRFDDASFFTGTSGGGITRWTSNLKPTPVGKVAGRIEAIASDFQCILMMPEAAHYERFVGPYDDEDEDLNDPDRWDWSNPLVLAIPQGQEVRGQPEGTLPVRKPAGALLGASPDLRILAFWIDADGKADEKGDPIPDTILVSRDGVTQKHKIDANTQFQPGRALFSDSHLYVRGAWVNHGMFVTQFLTKVVSLENILNPDGPDNAEFVYSADYPHGPSPIKVQDGFHPDDFSAGRAGTLLAACGGDRTARVWKTAKDTVQSRPAWIIQAAYECSSLCLSHGSDTVLLSDHIQGSWRSWLLDRAPNGIDVNVLCETSSGHLDIGQRGRRVRIVDGPRERIYDLCTGRPAAYLEDIGVETEPDADQMSTQEIKITPERALMIRSTDVSLVNTRNNTVLGGSIPLLNGLPRVSNDGSRLLVFSESISGAFLQTWDTDSGRALMSPLPLNLENSPMTSLHDTEEWHAPQNAGFCEDKNLIWTWDQGKIRIIDLEHRTELAGPFPVPGCDAIWVTSDTVYGLAVDSDAGKIQRYVIPFREKKSTEELCGLAEAIASRRVNEAGFTEILDTSLPDLTALGERISSRPSITPFQLWVRNHVIPTLRHHQSTTRPEN